MKKKDWEWVDWQKVSSIFVVASCVGLAIFAVMDMTRPASKSLRVKAKAAQQRVLGVRSGR